MKNYKLIFTGPPGAGKTTAISVISDTPVITTEAKTSIRDSHHPDKDSITVGLDYGSIKLSKEEKIHLYGTPGQERFDFMWKIIKEGGLGLILLIDNARSEPLEERFEHRRCLNLFFNDVADEKVNLSYTLPKRNSVLNPSRGFVLFWNQPNGCRSGSA